MNTREFYTYFHTRNDTGAVFYVGKGKGKRAHQAGRNPHWRNIVNKHGHHVHFAMTGLSESEAFEHEKFLILCFKGMGVKLANLTEGGDGVSGYKQPPEVVAANRARARAQMQRPEQIKKQSDAAKARWADASERPRLEAAVKRAFLSEEFLAKLSAAAKARWAKKEEREKQSARSAAWAEKPENKRSLSERARGRRPSEETKQKLSAASKGRAKSERTKARMKAAWIVRKASTPAFEGEPTMAAIPSKQTPPTPALPVPQRKQMAAGGSPVGTGPKTPA